MAMAVAPAADMAAEAADTVMVVDMAAVMMTMVDMADTVALAGMEVVEVEAEEDMADMVALAGMEVVEVVEVEVEVDMADTGALAGMEVVEVEVDMADTVALAGMVVVEVEVEEDMVDTVALAVLEAVAVSEAVAALEAEAALDGDIGFVDVRNGADWGKDMRENAGGANTTGAEGGVAIGKDIDGIKTDIDVVNYVPCVFLTCSTFTVINIRAFNFRSLCFIRRLIIHNSLRLFKLEWRCLPVSSILLFHHCIFLIIYQLYRCHSFLSQCTVI